MLKRDRKRDQVITVVFQIFLHCCADYIAHGPLLPLCGINKTQVNGEVDDWLKQGDFLAEQLGFSSRDQLNDIQRCNSCKAPYCTSIV